MPDAEIGDLVAEAGIRKAAVTGAATHTVILRASVRFMCLCEEGHFLPTPYHPTLFLLSCASAA